MDEPQWMNHWQKLMGSLYVYDDSTLSTPKPDDLDSAEQALKIAFPKSYRGFLRTFGPGVLAEAFTVYSPGFSEVPAVDFLRADGWQSVASDDRGGDTYPQQLVAFGDYLGHRGWFAWDRNNITDQQGPEYRIVFVPHLPDEPIIRVADSFRKWVEEAVFGLDFYRRYGVTITQRMLEWNDDETGETRTYRSFLSMG